MPSNLGIQELPLWSWVVLYEKGPTGRPSIDPFKEPLKQPFKGTTLRGTTPARTPKGTLNPGVWCFGFRCLELSVYFSCAMCPGCSIEGIGVKLRHYAIAYSSIQKYSQILCNLWYVITWVQVRDLL